MEARGTLDVRMRNPTSIYFHIFHNGYGCAATMRRRCGSMAEGAEKEALRAVEKTKASVRAFVEHPFHIVKNLFRHRKVRYRGLTKNGHQLYALFA